MADQWASTADHAPAGDWASTADHAAAPEQPGALTRYWNQFNPMNVVHALFKPSDDPKEDPRETFGKNALKMVKAIGEGHLEQFKQGQAAFDVGDYKSAIAHSVYALVPVIGPMGDAAGKDFADGNYAEGAGKLTAILGPKVLQEAAPLAGALAGKVGDVASKAVDATKEALSAPGTMDIAKGGAQGAGAVTALATGHPIVAGVAGLRAVENIGKGLKARADAANAVPPLYDQIAKGMGGSDYASLPDHMKAMIPKIADELNNPPAKPVQQTAPESTPQFDPTTDPKYGKSLMDLVDEHIAQNRGEGGVQPAGAVAEVPESASLRGPVRPPLGANPPGPVAEAPESASLRGPLRAPIAQPPNPLSVPARTDVPRGSEVPAVPEVSEPKTNISAPEAENRAALANDFVGVFKNAGITPEQVQSLTKEQWKSVSEHVDAIRGNPAGSLRVKPPSPDTIEEIVKGMGQDEPVKPVATSKPDAPAVKVLESSPVLDTPEKLSIAQRVAQEMMGGDKKPQGVADMMKTVRKKRTK